MLSQKIDRHTAKKKDKISLYVYIVIIVVFILALNLFIRNILLFPFTVKTDSMAKTVTKGDTVFISYAQIVKPKRGDIILVRQNKNDYFLFCRLSAMAGDSVSINNKKLIINNKTSKVKRYSADKNIISRRISERDQMIKQTVRPGNFFCLNDNHDNLQDSRTWGFIKTNRIIGKVIAKGWLNY